ncbi:hypothetical protein ACWEOP_37575 [Streptomyces chartreusis]
MRQEGWRDWHLLTAIANAVGNHRAQQQGLRPAPGDSREHRARILAAMQAPERPDDPPVPGQAFTEHALRSHLTVAAVSTAHGLAIRPGPLDPQALLSVLGDRYSYWTDEIEHTDPFDWPATQDDTT